MYAGPFNLAGLNTGTLEFDMWLDSEAGYDSVACLLSTDGLSFMGEMYSGYSAGWTHVAMDLRSVGGYHTNVTGESSVWIGFEFYSDDINLGVDYEGAYIDNVALSAALITPVISSVSPSQVSAGTQSTITIHGTGFGAAQGDQGNVQVETEKGFDMTAPVVSWSDTAIVVIVPATTSLSDGPVVGRVTVWNNLGRSAYTQQYAFHVSFAYGGARWEGIGHLPDEPEHSRYTGCGGDDRCRRCGCHMERCIVVPAHQRRRLQHHQPGHRRLQRYLLLQQGNVAMPLPRRPTYRAVITEYDFYFNDSYLWGDVVLAPSPPAISRA